MGVHVYVDVKIASWMFVFTVYCLIGLVVKAFTLEMADPGLISAFFVGIFLG